MLLIQDDIITIRCIHLPGQGVKVLSEGNPVEDQGLVQLSIHDGLLQDLAGLLVDQVPARCLDGEPQERHGVLVRVEEDVGVRAEETYMQGKHLRYTKRNVYCVCDSES